MGILDRLKSIVSTARAAVPQDLRGPLRLVPGDGIGYYKERWAVVGVRRVERQGAVLWQYCLRDRAGDTAVLASNESEEPTLRLERPVEADLPWDEDVLDGIADEPFRLSSRGRAFVAQAGDTPHPHVRSVDYREFADSSGDRCVLLEDWQGKRDVRVGEQVHEGELIFVRMSGSGRIPADFFAEEGAGGDRGSREAAAHALTSAHDGDEDEEIPVVDEAREDLDPTAFDDEEWDEEKEVSDPLACTGPLVEAVMDSEEDEWRTASKYIREHGIPADTKR